MLLKVSAPAIPSADKPLEFWNLITPCFVEGPKSQSMPLDNDIPVEYKPI